MNNQEENVKQKFIHRTITYWTGIEIEVDIASRSFKEVNRTWYDELDIPRGRVEKLEKHTQYYRLSIDDFMKYGEKVDEKVDK